jgi:hypothetical protein
LKTADHLKKFLKQGSKILYEISEMIDIQDDSQPKMTIQEAIWLAYRNELQEEEMR